MSRLPPGTELDMNNVTLRISLDVTGLVGFAKDFQTCDTFMDAGTDELFEIIKLSESLSRPCPSRSLRPAPPDEVCRDVLIVAAASVSIGPNVSVSYTPQKIACSEPDTLQASHCCQLTLGLYTQLSGSCTAAQATPQGSSGSTASGRQSAAGWSAYSSNSACACPSFCRRSAASSNAPTIMSLLPTCA